MKTRECNDEENATLNSIWAQCLQDTNLAITADQKNAAWQSFHRTIRRMGYVYVITKYKMKEGGE